MKDGEDGEDGGGEAAKPHEARVGFVQPQLVQGDKKVAGVFHHVQQQRRVVPKDVDQKPELDLQPQPQLLEPVVSPEPAPILAAFPSLPAPLTLHQDLDLVGIPAQVHDKGKEVIPKKEGRGMGWGGHREQANSAGECRLWRWEPPAVSLPAAKIKRLWGGRIHVLLAAGGLSSTAPTRLLPAVGVEMERKGKTHTHGTGGGCDSFTYH